jgi:PAS domain S-box-containing protein
MKYTKENIHKTYSISSMLTMSIVITVIIVSSLSVCVSYLRAKNRSQNDLANDMNKNLNEITDILEMPLWAYDIETIEDIGKLYSKNDTIVKLEIIDSLGKTLFNNERKDSGITLTRKKNVYHDNHVAGVVNMALSSKRYEEGIDQLLMSASITVGTNLLVLLLFTGYFLRRFLNKPLGKLREIVNSYAKGDYLQKDFNMPYIEFIPVVDIIKSMGLKITAQIDDLKMAQKKYRDIFENAVEGVFQIGLDERFIAINPAFAEIYGYDSPTELVKKKSAKDFFRSEEVFYSILKELDQSSVIKMVEFEGINKYNQTIWLSVSARVVIDHQGKALYYEGSLKDISDLKEKEVAKRKQQEADAANKAKTLFIANMSHEIRTPLNSILGMAELLDGTHCNQDQKEYIHVLKSSGKFLQFIINDILDFSKIEADQLDLENIPFNLNSILEDVINIISPNNDNIIIEHYIHSDIDQILIGDPVRIRQILINLAGNAVKFTKKGSVKIELYSKKSPYNTLFIEFKVVDTGIGIEKTKLDSIFQSFSQADSSMNRQYGGTGLGLAISKRLVGMMGGKLKVRSEINEGSVFYFTLEFKVSELTEMDLNKQDIQIETLPQLRVLLADDIEPNRTVIHKFLQDYPLELVDAENGLDALKLYKEEYFDLILMDVEMPVMNGLDATKSIRKWELEEGKVKTPIIVISAHAFGVQKKRCFEAGCDRLIIKPVRKNELINCISEVIEGKELPSKDLKEIPPLLKSNENYTVYIDKIFEDLMPEFVNYFNETLGVMERALLSNKYEDLIRLAHGLKGSSRNYELFELGEIFLAIEESAKKKAPVDITIKMDKAKNYIKNIIVEFVDKD